MTVVYSPTSVGQLTGFTVAVSAPGSASINTTGGGPIVAGLYYFAFSANIYFLEPITFTVTINNTPGDTYFILVVNDPSLFSTLPTGALGANQVPPQFGGTAPTTELARTTIATGNISTTFAIDLTLLTRFMVNTNIPINTTNQSFKNVTWTGALVLWLGCVAAGGAAAGNATLTAYAIQDYSNRDTGRSGAPVGSRVGRCPQTGFAISRSKMIRDGFTNLYVHPMAYDPAEPDDPEFKDYIDPNEDG